VRRAHANLWPDWAPEGLWELMNRWAEWRTVVGNPKSLRLPEAAFVHEIKCGMPVPMAGPGFCVIPSTAPHRPSRVEEFNHAFVGLDEDQQFYALALIDMQGEPWPGSDKWETFFSLLKLTPRQYKSLLHDALRSLLAFARARGLA